MTADIAHELRNPLMVMTGYIEALRDGVLRPSPERFDMMYEEAQQLQRLVADLRTLSLADAGELALMPQIMRACRAGGTCRGGLRAVAPKKRGSRWSWLQSRGCPT